MFLPKINIIVYLYSTMIHEVKRMLVNGKYYFDEELFAKRLTQLRMAKGVSSREMSLAIGQSNSYINRIENGLSLPSMTGFFYICEYLGVTPAQFFSYDIEDPVASDRFRAAAEKLSPKQAEHLMLVIDDILKK